MRRTTTLASGSRTLLFCLAALLLGFAPLRSWGQASQGQVADSTELRVLRAFYLSTHGDQWYNHAGWPATPAAWDTATVAQTKNWFGVYTGYTYGGDIEGLSLSGNNLRGSLPAALGQLRHLSGLYLAFNQLTGELPANMAQLTQMNQCQLEYNQLSGQLTGLFDHWNNLQSIDLGHNQFTGPIPSTLGQLPRLYSFGADYNQLSGTLPPALGNSPGVWVLNLTHNQLTGSIPGSWGRLGGLSQLFLGYNQLSGTLTDSLTGMGSLNYFDAEHNQLTGIIPPAFARFGQLARLDLSDNQFTGPIPDHLGAIYLLLHNNHLSGELPASYGIVHNYQILFDNNNITRIPHFNQPIGYPNIQLGLTGNLLAFDSYEPNQNTPGQWQFWDYGQRTPRGDTLQIAAGQAVTLDGTIGGQHNRYQWMRLVGGQWGEIPGQTQPTLTLTGLLPAQAGSYCTRVTNDWVPLITLYSKPHFLDVVPYPPLARNLPVDVLHPAGPQAPPTAPDAGASAPASLNFVRVWTPRQAITDSTRVPRAPVDSVATSTQYLDGLGRPVQTVLHQASPQRRDMVQAQAYDGLGREPLQYLPYPAEAAGPRPGSYRPQALTDQGQYYYRSVQGPLSATDATRDVVRTGVAYAETVFEASPLNRVTAQAAPGESWQRSGGHVQERQERPNTAQDSVPRFVPGYDPRSLDPGYQGFYQPGELWGVVVADTHGPNEPGAVGYQTIEWKDKLGQVVCKQVEAARTGTASRFQSRWLRTAYVYDDFQHLRFVLQPAGVKLLFAGLAQAANPLPSQGLQLWLPLDEAGGNQAADYSGQGRTGILSGGGTWQPTGGHDGGGALALVDGQSLHVPLSWQPTAFSVSFWLKPTRRYDWSQGTGAGWGPFLFHSTSGGEIYVGTDVPTRIHYGQPGTATAYVWQHFVFTLDAQGTGSLYKDGVQLAQQGGFAPAQPWSEFVLGISGDESYDEVRVYDRALAASEVQALHQAVSNSPTQLARYLFHYRYDGRGRQIAKQVPGQDGETLIVYDQLDRPVLTQDAQQRTRQEWSWSKYDALGRVVLTGLVTRTDTAGQVTLQNVATADTATAHQYEQRTADGASYPQYYTTGQAFPQLGQQGFGAGLVLTASYYDDYDFDNDGQANAHYSTITDAAFPAGLAPVADEARVTGMATHTLTRVLNRPAADPGADWLQTTSFYDERGRVVQVQSVNARDSLDVVTLQLDFLGKPVQTVARHGGPSHAPVQVVETSTYDHAERLRTTRQQLPGETSLALLSLKHYNELGQLTVDSLATGRLAQAVKYAYNIRGWLTSLNNPYQPDPADLFNLSLHYEAGFTTGYEQYNGNLTGQTWRGRDGVQRAYGYVYDPLNRVLQGDYVARAGGSAGTLASATAWTQELDNYRLSFVSYDDNGNINTLRRQGLLQAATHNKVKQYGAVDNLTYAYLGNRLQAVDDQVTGNQRPQPATYHGAPTSLAGDFQEAGVHQGQEYLYDANGNLTADKNKNITGILYNHLNLPRQIHFGSVGDSVVFRYTASGQKVAKLVYQTGKPTPQRTDYLGPYQYEGDSLKFFPHAAGRVLRFVSKDPAGQATVSYQREYTMKDHLGNLRLAYRAGQVRTLLATLEQDSTTHQRERQQFDAASVSQPIAQNVGALLAYSGQWVAKLNADKSGSAPPQPLGPLTQLGVQKGDTVTVQAFGYYPQATQHGFFFSLSKFLAALVGQQPSAPVGGDPGHGRKDLPLLQVGVATGLTALTPTSGGVPLGYLRVLVFDQDSALVSAQTQQVQLTKAANGNYEKVRLQVKLTQDGYVTAYVGNESDVDVYFDDVSVEHRPGLQVQETQYDPAGLELAGLAAPSPGIRGLNNYRFNGKEFQADLGLNWNHQDWRFLDPTILRWNGVDPEVESGQESWTPYSFGFDNAIRFADANGREPGGPGDPPSGTVNGPGIIVNTIVGLAVSVANTFLAAGDAFSPGGILVATMGGHSTRAVNNGDGTVSYNDRVAPTSGRELAGYAGADILDAGSAALTGVTVGSSGLASRGLPMATGYLLEGSGAVAQNEAVQAGKKAATAAYDVGSFNQLKNRSLPGDGLELHHAVQQQPGKSLISGYKGGEGPAIALPNAEHRRIPTLKGTANAGSARNQLAKDVRDLRNQTSAPNSSLQKLIDLNKTTYPNTFNK